MEVGHRRIVIKFVKWVKLCLKLFVAFQACRYYRRIDELDREFQVLQEAIQYLDSWWGKFEILCSDIEELNSLLK